MVTTDVMPAELHNLARAHLFAMSTFNRAYVRFWQAEVKPCSDDVGWKLLELFRGMVDEYCFKLNRRDEGIKQAAWELFRVELVGDADYQFQDVIGFVKWYEALKHKIGRAIGHLYDFHGDSFGDLVDSYPLAGRELVERALASHPKSDRPRREGYLDEREVGDAVLEKLGLQWHKLICVGENYVATALEAACHKCYLLRVRTGWDGQLPWTDDEQNALACAGHFGD